MASAHDIASLLEARAEALLRGVNKLPPIEQDLQKMGRRMSPTQPVSGLLVRPVPPGFHGVLAWNATLWRPVQLRNHHVCMIPITAVGGEGGAFCQNAAAFRDLRPNAAAYSEIKLPRATVPPSSKQPAVCDSTFGGFSSSLDSAARRRRSSDYAGVSPTTKELTIYSLVESMLCNKMLGQPTISKGPAVCFAQETAGSSASSTSRSGDRNIRAESSIIAERNQFEEGVCCSSATEVKEQMCISRCSTMIGQSHLSFLEEEDEEDLEEEDDEEELEDLLEDDFERSLTKPAAAVSAEETPSPTRNTRPFNKTVHEGSSLAINRATDAHNFKEKISTANRRALGFIPRPRKRL
eukprot:Gregarina_sp_Poly_1__351@NODE_1085_length_5145_cov_250_530327_g753_i0_p1_GENE_NODE_1085_length_5145_cov_250_530327_g753_i0NODE_1085_length_5145_cov_250_530327_g753_i0_p1_ORF_typecomplete_len352_score51_80DUF2890/PF11081_8/2_5e03DUF2890/PF11081_8/0_37_NODE_1085_length_5145_cov_250_530327_g753_i01011156